MTFTSCHMTLISHDSCLMSHDIHPVSHDRMLEEILNTRIMVKQSMKLHKENKVSDLVGGVTFLTPSLLTAGPASNVGCSAAGTEVDC